MQEPAIKGSILAGVVEDLARLRDEGRVSGDELEARLEPGHLTLLESKINAGSWYPIASYAQFVQLLGDIEGGGEAYFIERGRKNARRLMYAGLYQQLNFISRWRQSAGANPAGEAAAIASFTRNLKLVITLATSIYNVGSWVVEPDRDYPGRVWIAVRDASDYSEPMRLAAEGFLNECALDRDDPDHRDMYTSERPSLDSILFRMNFDIADIARRGSANPAHRD